MLTREQIYTMLMLRSREDNIFSVLPNELICYIGDMNNHPNSDISIALRHAASGEREDIAIVIKMVKKNPSLLLQAGNVVTRGGVLVMRTTLYEFFLGEGDPTSAKQVGFGFTEIRHGENERRRQYERYRPHIDALANQIESKQPAFDLRPLIAIIKKSSPLDITAALNKDMKHESALCDALIAFRNAVRPKKQTVGMHYAHYATLMQGLVLLYEEWKELSDNYTNYDKCELVWRQLIGYLQRGLPCVERFAFAHAFKNNARSVDCEYSDGTFPDISSDDAACSGLGFDEAIFGVRGRILPHKQDGAKLFVYMLSRFVKHMSNKNTKLAELMLTSPQQYLAISVSS